MALGAPTERMVATETGSDNQISSTLASGISAGNYVWAYMQCDPLVTTDGDQSLHSAVTVGGLSLTKAKEWAEGGASAGDGVAVSMWYGTASGAISSGATVTGDFASAVANKGLWIFSGTMAGGNSLAYEAVAANPNQSNYVSAGGNDITALATSGLTSREHLHIRIAGGQSGTSTFTVTATWTTLRATTVIGTATRMSAERLIATDTGASSDPSSNAGNGTEWAHIIVSFHEQAAAVTLPQTTMTTVLQAVPRAATW